MKPQRNTPIFPSFFSLLKDNVQNSGVLNSKRKRNLKAELFNKKASDPINEPDEILHALELKTGQAIADIGSGGGYFTLRFAETVGVKGHVFAVDTNPDFLSFIQNAAKEKELLNVETILTKKDNPNLPEKSVDLVFMRNVCHHLANRPEYFKRLKNALETGGRVAIIEYRRTSGLSLHNLFGHSLSKETIIKEMQEAGYQLEKDLEFLPQQSFTIFSQESVPILKEASG
ncbi:MAG: methyltransferase domain-containing protein [Candidatus Bathyarchaeota archaeon]|nr:methyltransferase domain-containing protein [Candidatus Bathyarchaeota archaeon]